MPSFANPNVDPRRHLQEAYPIYASHPSNVEEEFQRTELIGDRHIHVHSQNAHIVPLMKDKVFPVAVLRLREQRFEQGVN